MNKSKKSNRHTTKASNTKSKPKNPDTPQTQIKIKHTPKTQKPKLEYNRPYKPTNPNQYTSQTHKPINQHTPLS